MMPQPECRVAPMHPPYLVQEARTTRSELGKSGCREISEAEARTIVNIPAPTTFDPGAGYRG
jgi:hypothetical protein